MAVEPTDRSRRRFPIAIGPVDVRRVRRLSPRMIRITLGGATLGAFPNDEPGEIVTLIWPVEGRDLVLPATGWSFPPEAAEQPWRNYTVRAFRADGDRTELDVDFVLHGDHGHASRWAARAQPGETIGIAGPRLHWTTDPHAEWTLLAGDATALPAIGAILESLPADHAAHVFVEVGGRDEQLVLESACPARVTWVHRGDVPAGRGTGLVDAIRAARLPRGRGKAWAAGESLAIRDVRRYLRDGCGMPADAVQALGYWRHRETPEDVE